MAWMTWVLLAAGLILLVVGGELLVRGASRLAALFEISPLVIGLTIVAYGTSSPELAVSVQAGLAGNADIAVANVVGSNIFNILFILGLCALLAPLTVQMRLIRLETPLVISLSILMLAMALDGGLGAGDGSILLGGVVVYSVWAIRSSRREGEAVKTEFAGEYGEPPLPRQRSAKAVLVQSGMVAAGLGLLVLGSRWLVEGATNLARALGVGDVVIGLTIVAAGTSLPEVATSVVATLRGERDIAIGNVLGSNIYNILAILGAAALLTPGGLSVAPSLLRLDIPVMIAAAVACLPIFFSDLSITRWEGAFFLLMYGAYAVYLLLAATAHEALPAFSAAMIWFVLPVVGLTLGVIAVRSIARRRR